MRTSITKSKKIFLKKIFVIFFWILIWELLALNINEELILVSPITTFKKIISISLEFETYIYVLNSLKKILVGLLAGMIFGIMFAVISYKNIFLRELLHPFLIFLKSVPLISFVILLLIWFNSQNLSIYVSLIMVTPIIFANVYEGLITVDKKMLEMSKLYKLTIFQRIKFIYLPHLAPYIASALITSVGISWKSGITAEVIGLQTNTIGEQLYNAKIYLDTEIIFAYIVIIVLISLITEKAISYFLKKVVLKRYFDD